MNAMSTAITGYEDDQETRTWIQRFCSRRGHEFFCAFSPGFIKDASKLTGLKEYVSKFQEAWSTILVEESEAEQLEIISRTTPNDHKSLVVESAQLPYRYVTPDTL